MPEIDPPYEVWAANLDEALTTAGLSDVKVAAELDCHQQTVRRWRTDGRIPDEAKVRLAALLKVKDARDLFPFEVAA